ncbi:MAG: hypothetical protein EOP22_13690 [Hyphomicrobiales bacterium]|nr:MAG: hypothetical protein EOP22_13690 [Hyphomicrobiales bacterium]
MARILSVLAAVIAASLAGPGISRASDQLPAGFAASDLNGSIPPVVADGEITFHIMPKDCSDTDYGNGSGESDCLNGNTKNVIQRHEQARLGDAVEYRFDIWVDPAFSYRGYTQGETYPFGGKGHDTRLRVASWEGEARKNFVNMLKLDALNGLTFQFLQCQAPEDFGKWVSFSMKVRWANDARGWKLVTCDGRAVFVSEGAATNEQPHCYYGNECDPEKPIKYASRFLFILGLAMNGWGQNWQELSGPTIGPFTAFSEDGLTIKMRNISVVSGAELYGEAQKAQVRQLQELLNGLGCDVGTPDGVVGKRTREAALTCRDIEGLPEALNVTNVQAFIDLYSI